jgi:LysM repeat protein
MSRRLILIMSVGLNLLLVLALLAAKHHRAPVQTVPATPVATVPAPKTQVVVRKQYFSWPEVESPDYQVYIANLRAIDCPEPTIRDIIVADVNQLYSWKRLTEVVSPDQEWWKSDPDTNMVASAAAKRSALDQERRNLLTTLLGTNWDSGTPLLDSPVTLTGPVLGDLSPEAKHSVQEILARSRQRHREYSEAQANLGRPQDPAELARLDQQMRTELAQIMVPAQMEEFLLRNSTTAAGLRQQLRGIDVTPTEFRNLFEAADPLNNQVAEYVPVEGQTRNSFLATTQQQFEDDLKLVLGPERYQQYRIAQDPIYRDAVAQTEDAGAPPETAEALYQLNKAAAAQRNAILSNDTLTPDQKTAQLAALTQQQQTASDQILGVAPPEPPSPPEPPLPPGIGPVQVHSYFPGESVDQIATEYGVSASSILNANPNLNFNSLQKGTPINVPVKPQ